MCVRACGINSAVYASYIQFLISELENDHCMRYAVEILLWNVLYANCALVDESTESHSIVAQYSLNAYIRLFSLSIMLSGFIVAAMGWWESIQYTTT